MSETPTPTPTDGTTRSTTPPNYAARRMLVTTVAIMAIVAFAVIGYTVVRGDDDSTGGGGGSWDEIALVDRVSGDVVVVDGDGDVVDTIEGLGRVTDVYAIGSRTALVGATQIVLDGDGEQTVVEIDRTDTVTPIRTPGTLHLVVGDANGGDVAIVDVITGEQLNVGELAEQAEPQIFSNALLFAETLRWSADATSFAVADASSFQTIVVRSGSTEVAFFGSQPVALSGDRVVTSQTIGGQADIELLDYERDSKARVPTPIPAGGVMVDDDLLMVSIDGGVYRITGGSTEAERLGQVAVPSGGTVASVRPTFDGERLVVTGPAFEAVIDLEGRTIFTTTFTAPIDTVTPHPDWTCLPVGGDGSYHSLVALESGDQLADLSGVDVVGTSADGCIVLGERAGITELITADGNVSLGRVRSAALGPDGRTVVRTTTTGTTEVVRVDDDLELGDPVELTASPLNPVVAFLH
ncbi:MAG: hypothetical protein R8G01_15020 [Ilumatobacteraceae bacterium]|nr:hypothetical protein [Ilumatobacteraceae bacterium]